MSTVSAGSANTTSGLVNLSDLGTNINTTQIIAGLTQINQNQINTLQTQEQSIQTDQSDWGQIQTDLTSLQSAVAQLSSNATSALGGFTATTSDPTTLTAAADNNAQAGTYNVTVDSLAEAEQLGSTGVSSQNAAIQQGTLQIQVGNGATTTVTINSSNDTLQGLANAINGSGADVQASIVNNGSSTDPYQLLLTSTQTGTANSIQVTNNLNTGSGASLDFNQVIQPAADAQVTLGSGSGALTFSSASNTINDAISGVTLNLLQADPSTPQTLTIAPDTSTASTAIQGFVSAYNQVMTDFSNYASYNASTQTGGPLLGNTDLLTLQNSLQDAVSSTVTGSDGDPLSLESIGLSFSSSGQLDINQTTLNQALSGDLPGVSIGDVQSLFELTGNSSSPNVSFLTGSSATQPSGATPYTVDITQAAQQATVTATNALPDTIDVTSSDNAFQLNVNTIKSSVLTIPPGSYTPDQLATAMQTAISSDPLLSNNGVSVGLNSNNQLTLTTAAYGSASEITFAGGSALGSDGPLGFTGSEGASGLDVQGSFIVNGKTETATGIGQILSGNTGNANTDGLQVQVTLNPSQVSSSGTESTLSVTAGLGVQLGSLINGYLEPDSGTLANINTEYSTDLTNLTTQVNTDNTNLETQENTLVSQFQKMEQTLSQLQNMNTEMNDLLQENSSLTFASGGTTANTNASSS